MKRHTHSLFPLSLLLVLFTSACVDPCANRVSGADYQNSNLPLEDRVDDLLSYMSLDEKLSMLATAKPIWSVLDTLFESSENCRLGIPPFRTAVYSGSRGASKNATAFPVAMARAASWDRDLEYRVSEGIALEASALNMNLFLAPVLTIVRHPGMGRAQETYGEDTFLMGEMGINAIEGIQRYMPAQVKHYALNSIEENRYSIDIQTDERTLREIYLPHYKKAVQQANVASIMTAYNRVNGIYASENAHLLQGILRDDWGFDGIVMSDWIDGVNSTVAAANNGLDMEMPIANYFKKSKLANAISSGQISVSRINDINRHILRQKFAWGHFDGSTKAPYSVVRSPQSRALALEAARESMTLLKNTDSALPLVRESLNNVVVLGPSASIVSLGDRGSSQVNDFGSDAVSPLQGIVSVAQGVTVSHYVDLVTAPAQAAIASADAVIVIASLNAYDEGEWIQQEQLFNPGLGGDRRNLSLHADEVALIQQASAAHENVIVVIQGGSAVTVADWEADVEAILMAWYPGVKGGVAIAETLFGDNNPGGKTPISWPVSEDQLYEFGSLMPSVVYGFYQGYRYYDSFNLQPQYPFGHGLSYTSFSYSNLATQIDSSGTEPKIIVSFDLTNTGDRAGKEVVQLYVAYQNSAIERAAKDLKGFDKIALDAGESRQVILELPKSELRYWDTTSGQWEFENISYQINVGASSRDILLSGTVAFP